MSEVIAVDHERLQELIDNSARDIDLIMDVPKLNENKKMVDLMCDLIIGNNLSGLFIREDVSFEIDPRKLDEDVVDKMAEALEKNTSLTKLDLTNNGLYEREVLLLAGTVEKNNPECEIKFLTAGV